MKKLVLRYWGHPIIKGLLISIYFLRFVIPFLIFTHPIFCIFAEYALDYGDSVFGFYSKLFSWKFCYRMDKFLDYWFYIFVLLFSKNYTIFPILFILFLYRSVGQFLSISTYKEKQLLFFPNLFELYFISYVTSWFYSPLKNFFYGTNNILLLGLLLPLAFGREYLIHVKKPIPKMFRKDWLAWKNV